MGTSEEANRFGESIWYWVRTHRRSYALLIAFVFILQLVALYQRLGRTTLFTSENAVVEFRKKQAAANAAQPTASPSPQAQAAAPAQPAAASDQKTSKSAAAAGPAAPQCDWVCPTNSSPPDNGVYQYFQCGKSSGQCTGDPSEPPGNEKVGPSSRDFPRTGQRIITTTGPNTWTNSHVYAEEHREEFDLKIDQTGVYNSRYKVAISLGPIQGGNEFRMDPAFQLNKWPMSLNLAWNGSWTDLNRKGDADWGCKAVAKEELNIGGQKVKTWAVECRIRLKGPETTGDVFIKFWVAPDYRNTVQEYYEEHLNTPQGTYDGKWMATLANVKPQR